MREKKFYGQRELDAEIELHFQTRHHGSTTWVTKRGGFAVEVGAYDGVKGSNTKYFEEFHNWNTVCIEPNGKAFKELVRNRPRSECLKLACASSSGMKEFTIVEMESGIESSLSSLNIDPRLVDEYGHDIKSQRKITVITQTLDYILGKKYPCTTQPMVDFVSIDTEGTELDVLRGFDLDYWKPKLLVIENNYEDQDISIYLEQFAYKRVSRHHVNDLYLRQYNL